jgi:Fe-S cluster biogenesis protein NfuA
MDPAALADRVNRAFATDLVPVMQEAGLDLRLAGVDPDGVVRVQVADSCASCPSTTMTLIMGIERRLLELVPEVAYLEVTQG